MLELHNVSRRVGSETHLADVTLRFDRGTFNTLLGPTLAGKTSLLRVMAGLDPPTGGSLWFDGKDVTELGARKRSVALVYQQFINYPNLSVFENIASPLRVQGKKKAEVEAEVKRAADLLKLSTYLDRKPGQLSGGQQQRVALARAIVRKADIVLLDEPLANLDYKLREELRTELPKLFAETQSVVVYATTDPAEALLLGGEVATISEGRITQVGETLDVYRNPKDLVTAQIMTDPPLNTLKVVTRDWKTTPRDDVAPPCRLPLLAEGVWTFAFRAHHLKPGEGGPNALGFPLRVVSTEITGSETFVHVAFGSERWVMLLNGVQRFEPDQQLEGHVDAADAMVFDARDKIFDGAIREAA